MVTPSVIPGKTEMSRGAHRHRRGSRPARPHISNPGRRQAQPASPSARPNAPPANPRLSISMRLSLPRPPFTAAETAIGDQALQVCAGWPGTAILADEAVGDPSTETAPSAEVIGLPASAVVTCTGSPSLPALTFGRLAVGEVIDRDDTVVGAAIKLRRDAHRRELHVGIRLGAVRVVGGVVSANCVGPCCSRLAQRPQRA